MDFQLELQQLASLGEERASAKAAYDRTDSAYNEKSSALKKACRPACERAVEKYNERSESLKIRNDFRLIFSSDKPTLSLSVLLKYPNGNEPDEDFEFDDVERITNAFRPIIEIELNTASIPLSFDKLSVPTYYYSK